MKVTLAIFRARENVFLVLKKALQVFAVVLSLLFRGGSGHWALFLLPCQIFVTPVDTVLIDVKMDRPQRIRRTGNVLERHLRNFRSPV
jgi:hypothetical protein